MCVCPREEDENVNDEITNTPTFSPVSVFSCCCGALKSRRHGRWLMHALTAYEGITVAAMSEKWYMIVLAEPVMVTAAELMMLAMVWSTCRQQSEHLQQSSTRQLLTATITTSVLWAISRFEQVRSEDFCHHVNPTVSGHYRLSSLWRFEYASGSSLLSIAKSHDYRNIES